MERLDLDSIHFYFWILPSRSCFSTFEKKNVKWGRKDRLKKKQTEQQNKANQKIVYFKIKSGYSQVPSIAKCDKIVLLLLLLLSYFELVLILFSNDFTVKHFCVICEFATHQAFNLIWFWFSLLEKEIFTKVNINSWFFLSFLLLQFQ